MSHSRPRRSAAARTDLKMKAALIAESNPVAGKKKPSRTKSLRPNGFQADIDNDVYMEDVSLPLEALVDPTSMYHGTHKVLIGEDGDPFDAMLVCVDFAVNANKYYVLQLLRPDSLPSPGYVVSARHDRIGQPGRLLQKVFTREEDAIKEFKKTFRQKTLLDWDDRKRPSSRQEKTNMRSTYIYLHQANQSYFLVGRDPGRPVDGNLAGEDSEQGIGTVPNPLKLVCDLIFETAPRKQQPGYQHNLVPLGHLPHYATMKAVSILKELAEEILAKREDRLLSLNNKYFTFAPRVSRAGSNSLGSLEPIRTQQDVREELEVLRSLGYLKVARDFRQTLDSMEGRSPIYTQLAMLNLKYFRIVDKSSVEYALIKGYAEDTTDPFDLCVDIEDVFQVERHEEDERWIAKGWQTRCQDGDRRLLWHGSRACNMTGILKQGLKIAPEGVALNGSEFGKGLYFSDLFQLSAKYTQSESSDNVGLVLLCEVVACPSYETNSFDENAEAECLKQGKVATLALGRKQHTAWKDAGDALERVDLKGVKIPRGKPELKMNCSPKKCEPDGNEYVIYDISQVKIRYMVKVRITPHKF